MWRRSVPLGLRPLRSKTLPVTTSPTQSGAQSPSRPLVGHDVAGEDAIGRAAFDRRAARAVFEHDVAAADDVVAGFDEIAAHLGAVDAVVGDLSAAAAIEMRAVGPRTLEPAAADHETRRRSRTPPGPGPRAGSPAPTFRRRGTRDSDCSSSRSAASRTHTSRTGSSSVPKMPMPLLLRSRALQALDANPRRVAGNIARRGR